MFRQKKRTSLSIQPLELRFRPRLQKQVLASQAAPAPPKPWPRLSPLPSIPIRWPPSPRLHSRPPSPASRRQQGSPDSDPRRNPCFSPFRPSIAANKPLLLPVDSAASEQREQEQGTAHAHRVEKGEKKQDSWQRPSTTQLTHLNKLVCLHFFFSGSLTLLWCSRYFGQLHPAH
jgi:hypothetical protein